MQTLIYVLAVIGVFSIMWAAAGVIERLEIEEEQRRRRERRWTR